MPTFLENINAINHNITREDAAAMVSALNTAKENMLATGYKNNDCMVLNETFNKAAIQELLDQENCEAFRVHLGMDANNKLRIILSGVAADGTDVVNRYIANSSDTMEGIPTVHIDEAGQRWP
jgi:hypothetical protein